MQNVPGKNALPEFPPLGFGIYRTDGYNYMRRSVNTMRFYVERLGIDSGPGAAKFLCAQFNNARDSLESAVAQMARYCSGDYSCLSSALSKFDAAPRADGHLADPLDAPALLALLENAATRAFFVLKDESEESIVAKARSLQNAAQRAADTPSSGNGSKVRLEGKKSSSARPKTQVDKNRAAALSQLPRDVRRRIKCSGK